MIPALKNIRLAGRASRKGGYFMIELMVYIAIVGLVMGLAFGAFYRTLDTWRDLSRNANDIARALKAGERWREDVRLAIAPPEKLTDGSAEALEITQPDLKVVYVFNGETVWRKQGDYPAEVFLSNVKHSEMLRDQRLRVVSWRWELELISKKKIVRIRPQFTFQAVARGTI
jgi:hypothetical protein